MNRQLALSLAPPIGAAALEMLLFPWIKPAVWILFYPAVFLSGRIGGMRGGVAATALSIILVWYCFIPPEFSSEIDEPRRLFAPVVFAAMGYLISKTQEDLRRRKADSDARFFAMFETSASGVAIVAPDRRFLRVNSRLCEMLGYSPEELVTKTFVDITHPDDIASSLALRQRLLDGGTAPPPLEKRYQRKDGTYLWVSVGLSIARRRGEKPEQYIAVVEDIDARKQTELELRAARVMLESALAGMSDAVVIMDADGNVQHFNEAFVILHGFASAAETLRNCHDYLEILEFKTEDGAPVSVEEWPGPRALGGETVSGIEYSVQRKDTGKAWIGSYNFAPIRDGDGAITGAVITVRDVTQRKKVERALRESEQRLHLFIERAPAALAMFDRKMRYVAVSRRWRDEHGLAEDVIGRSSYETFPDTPPRWREAHARGLAGEVVRNNEDCIPRADGTVQWLRWEIHPWRLSDGSVGGILVFAEDVTKLHDAREEILRLNADLEKRVEERTAELVDARAKAEAANAAKSIFLANMSHEIRTPINAILGFSRLMQREAMEPLEKERLGNIAKAGKHLLSLISDILDLSKIEAGHLQLEKRDFEVGQILADVASIVAGAASAKGIRVAVDTASMPRRVFGDDTRVRQALLNYAYNSVKFTESGQITIRAILCEEAAGEILARFEVEDTGIGIAPDLLPRLFTAFEQGEVSTTRKYGGTGLGLAITRRLAKLMGGDAGGANRPGGGSIFWFTARLLKSRNDAITAATQSAMREGDGNLRSHARILLVEDNDINRQVAVEMLQTFELDVDCAVDGLEACEKAQAGEHDLILMDIQMPKLDGMEATRRIRALPNWATKPIIALTANVFEDDRRACAQAGMDDFVPKPIDPQQLYRVLSRWLPAEGGRSAPPPVAQPHTAVLSFQAPWLDAEEGLKRVNGDAALYRKLLMRFAQERGAAADMIAADLREGRKDDAARLAHDLKGVMGTLGIKASSIAGALEWTILNGAEEMEAQALAEKLRNELATIIASIKDGVSIESCEAPGEGMACDRLRRSFAELEAALVDGDVRANEICEMIGPSLRKCGGDVEALIQRIEAYDYPNALATLRKLKDLRFGEEGRADENGSSVA